MGTARVRKPSAPTVLPLSAGDSITVKTHLNSGETRDLVGRLYEISPAGDRVTVDPIRAGLVKILGYLLDWTFTNHDGVPLAILHQSEADVIAALAVIDPEDYSEVLRAIEAHDAAMGLARLAEKNARAGGTPSSAISTSASGPAGPSTTSAPSA